MTGRTTAWISAPRATVNLVCVLAALAAGCASSPPSRYYTLSSTVQAGAAPAAAASGISVEVGPVLVPAVVDRPEIVLSAGPNEVRLAEFDRWAAPLQDNLSRVVADNLAAMLGTVRVTVFPQTLGGEPDYRIAIDVQRFESVAGTSAAMDALWTVRRTRDGRERRGGTSVREPLENSGFEALAAAHSRGVARLSRDVMEAVRSFETGVGR